MARFSQYRCSYAFLLWLRPQLEQVALKTHLTRFAFSLIALFGLITLGSGGGDNGLRFTFFIPSGILVGWILWLNYERATHDESFGEFYHAPLKNNSKTQTSLQQQHHFNDVQSTSDTRISSPGYLTRDNVGVVYEPLSIEPLGTTVADNATANGAVTASKIATVKVSIKNGFHFVSKKISETVRCIRTKIGSGSNRQSGSDSHPACVNMGPADAITLPQRQSMVLVEKSTNRQLFLRGVNLSGATKMPYGIKSDMQLPESTTSATAAAVATQNQIQNQISNSAISTKDNSKGSSSGTDQSANSKDSSNILNGPNHNNVQSQSTNHIINSDNFESISLNRSGDNLHIEAGNSNQSQTATLNTSFVGRPFPLSEADEHFARLRAYGLTFLRLLITWEAVEHEGPGIYDYAYLEYLRNLVKKAEEYGISVFIDPHQDVWSRWTGGDGAPLWTLEIVGFDVSTFRQTLASVRHSDYVCGLGSVTGSEGPGSGPQNEQQNLYGSINNNSRLSSPGAGADPLSNTCKGSEKDHHNHDVLMSSSNTLSGTVKSINNTAHTEEQQMKLLKFLSTTREGDNDTYPNMSWANNYNHLACATMFTLFFGGDDFAPFFRVNKKLSKLYSGGPGTQQGGTIINGDDMPYYLYKPGAPGSISGTNLNGSNSNNVSTPTPSTVPQLPVNDTINMLFTSESNLERENFVSVQSFLQDHFIAAMREVAKAIKDCDNVLGFDTLNEPDYGYIGRGAKSVKYDTDLREYETLKREKKAKRMENNNSSSNTKDNSDVKKNSTTSSQNTNDISESIPRSNSGAKIVAATKTVAKKVKESALDYKDKREMPMSHPGRHRPKDDLSHWQGLGGGQIPTGFLLSPYESMLLGSGMSCSVDEFEGIMKYRKTHDYANPGRRSCWKAGYECIWKQHGVYEIEQPNEELATAIGVTKDGQLSPKRSPIGKASSPFQCQKQGGNVITLKKESQSESYSDDLDNDNNIDQLTRSNLDGSKNVADLHQVAVRISGDAPSESGSPMTKHRKSQVTNKRRKSLSLRNANLLRPDYFARNPKTGKIVNPHKDYLIPFWKKMKNMLRSELGTDGLLFCSPYAHAMDIQGHCDAVDSLEERNEMENCIYSPHYYEGINLLFGPHHDYVVANMRHISSGLPAHHFWKKNAGLPYTISSFDGTTKSIKKDIEALRYQGRNLGPTIIGEIGINMNDQSDADRSRTMERMIRGLEGSLVTGYTLWNYTPDSREPKNSLLGDGWNKENLSIFSNDRIPGKLDAENTAKFQVVRENARVSIMNQNNSSFNQQMSLDATVKSITEGPNSDGINDGADGVTGGGSEYKPSSTVAKNISIFAGGRCLPSVIRPFPFLVAGRVLNMSFSGLTKHRRFRLDYEQVDHLCNSNESIIFVPLYQYGDIPPILSSNFGPGSNINSPIKTATSPYVKLVSADMKKQQFIFQHDQVLTQVEPVTWRKLHWIEIWYEP